MVSGDVINKNETEEVLRVSRKLPKIVIVQMPQVVEENTAESSSSLEHWTCVAEREVASYKCVLYHRVLPLQATGVCGKSRMYTR